MREFPSIDQLTAYRPPLTTNLRASDDQLIAEYALERRQYLKIEEIPDVVKSAFIAAEDKNFHEHRGLDYPSLLLALGQDALALATGRGLVGASTITQQVVKNVLVGGEKSIDRKAAEALLAWRTEEALAKDYILEIYLNEVFLGLQSYGVAEASRRYFDKAVDELTLAEAAYLAALPKAPSRYHPLRFPERAVGRRNWVIDHMVSNGFVTAEEGQRAAESALSVTISRPPVYRAEYFSEEARRELVEILGEDQLYSGGLSVETTLDPAMQEMAHQALSRGLVKFDMARGWRGPVAHVDGLRDDDWQQQLNEVSDARRLNGWNLAVVLSVTSDEATIGLWSDADADDQTSGTIPFEHAKWATGERRGRRVRAVADVLSRGDVVYVEPTNGAAGEYRLRQVPEVSGALVALEPQTGRVRAMVGGFSFDVSQFNRATQAMRQPGSSFKPFIYAAALELGYTPSSVVLDAPISIDRNDGLGPWQPKNYSGKFYGPTTLRNGLERSRNVMTVRLAQELGMAHVADVAKQFGIYDEIDPFPAMALGAGETTLLRMAAGYAAFANGGYRIQPSFVDEIRDRNGQTIFANGGSRTGQQQFLSRSTAYQITSLLEGVVQRGTGTAARGIEHPVAGKTGTTNDQNDAWFIGYTPDLVVGVYIGFDTPRSLGEGATGGRLAAPIFTDFMQMALAAAPRTPFAVPDEIKLVRVNLRTGVAVRHKGPGTILEAFNPSTSPPERPALAILLENPNETVAEVQDYDKVSPSGVPYSIRQGGKIGTYTMGGRTFTYERN